MIPFTYCKIPKERYDIMLSMEEQFAEKAIEYRKKEYPGFDPSWVRDERVMVCSGKEDGDRPSILSMWTPTGQLETRCRFVYTTSTLEIGKEYPVIIFPKTCSAGFGFVKES